jgi:8-oxo-dGTP pyrophosphatase MutT (NUDIX family)
MIRHFTSTGIVVANGAALVHWHAKVQAWLAPGGHVEPDEDPVQATIREVKEETSLDVRILQTSALPNISNLPQIAPPFTVMVEDVVDETHGPHQHIDFIYFTTPVRVLKLPGSGDRPSVPDGWHWVTLEGLQDGTPLKAPNGQLVAPPEDVLKLSIMALDLLETETGVG